MTEQTVQLELDPAQPAPVVAAVARVLAAEAPQTDPWWLAGLEENLDDEA